VFTKNRSKPGTLGGEKGRAANIITTGRIGLEKVYAIGPGGRDMREEQDLHHGRG